MIVSYAFTRIRNTYAVPGTKGNDRNAKGMLFSIVKAGPIASIGVRITRTLVNTQRHALSR